MITLRTFEHALDAHLLKSKLESEGIPAYIFDENIMTLNPLYNISVGGIKVRISKLDLERAQLILAEIDDKNVMDNNGDQVVCPRCNSTSFFDGYKTIKNPRGIAAFFVSLLLLIYPFYYKL